MMLATMSVVAWKCNFLSSANCPIAGVARAENPKYDLKNQHLQHCALQAQARAQRHILSVEAFVATDGSTFFAEEAFFQCLRS